MTVLVGGATGAIGSELVGQLLAAGHDCESTAPPPCCGRRGLASVARQRRTT